MGQTPAIPSAHGHLTSSAYDKRRDSAALWCWSADQLKRAVDVLCETSAAEAIELLRGPVDVVGGRRIRRLPPGRPPPLMGPIALLGGYAMENILKAVILSLRQAKPPAESGSLKGWELKTHDLRRLAGLAGFSVSDAETALLEGRAEAVKWMGRYPVAGSAGQTGNALFLGLDRNVFDPLYERAKQQYTRNQSQRQPDAAVPKQGSA